VTGQTQAAGWQVGARRTLPLELAEAWELLTSPPWLDRWSGLPALDRDDPAVRALTAPRVARVRTRDSLVQMRVQGAVSGTTVAFHEEHLPDEQTRNLRKAHWAQVLDDLEATVSALSRHHPSCGMLRADPPQATSHYIGVVPPLHPRAWVGTDAVSACRLVP